MVIISDSRVDGSPSIWAEDHTCKSSNNGKCKISSPKTLREYVVRVTATDESGNSHMVQCNTIVGGDQGDIAAGDPLFLISKVDIVGGVEPNEASSNLLLGAESGEVDSPWGEDDVTINPLSSSPSSSPTSAPSLCSKVNETPPEGDCSRCCSGQCKNSGITCRKA